LKKRDIIFNFFVGICVLILIIFMVHKLPRKKEIVTNSGIMLGILVNNPVIYQEKTKHLIIFRGLGGLLETEAIKKYSENNNYKLKIYHYTEIDNAIKYIQTIDKNNFQHKEIWGFSKGAESAYETIELTPNSKYAKLITIGTYPTVTSSFGESRPIPSNVRKHKNYVESWQQPKEFTHNKNNISLGNVAHMEALSKTISILQG